MYISEGMIVINSNARTPMRHRVWSHNGARFVILDCGRTVSLESAESGWFGDDPDDTATTFAYCRACFKDGKVTAR